MPYAEYWLGDHVNGPSKVLVDSSNARLTGILGNPDFCAKFDKQYVDIATIIKMDPQRFLGHNYRQKYPDACDSFAFMFKILSVKTALSI